MKKLVVFLLALLFLNILTITSTQAQEIGESGLPPEIEKIQDIGEKVQEQKASYLTQQWKKMLLENKFISALDSFFTKISAVFKVLFGQPYSLSLTLLIIIILWFYFFFIFGRAIEKFGFFSSGVAWIIGLTITILLAHFKILEYIAKFFMWLAFGDKPWWLIILTVLAIIIGLGAICIVLEKFGAQIAENRKKMKETLREIKMAKGEKSAEALSEAAEGLKT